MKLIKLFGTLLLSSVTAACAAIMPRAIDDGTGGGLCWACQGARECKIVRAGSSNCDVTADSSGISCTAWGKCGVGNVFGGNIVLYSVPPKDSESVEVEQRVNRYFHKNVIPRSQECWRTLKGEGAIVVRHSYSRKDRGNWAPEQLEIFRSSLLADQTEAALKCIRNAVQGTSFPSDRWDGEAKEFVLFWEWPVPFPKTAQ